MIFPQLSVLCRYRYDPLDRLISHAQSTAPQHRFYCKNRLVTEIQGALTHSIIQHGDLVLAQHQHENEAFVTTLLLTDLQRSVLHTLEKDTGRHPIAYVPYGHRSAESRLISVLGFNGERPDPVTRHYLLGNGYRAFNPVLMRFNSPDSWSPFGKGGLNSYVYCMGDPINQTDPTGHFSNGRPLPFPMRIASFPSTVTNALRERARNFRANQLTNKINKTSKLKTKTQLSNYNEIAKELKEAQQLEPKQPKSLQELTSNMFLEEDLKELSTYGFIKPSATPPSKATENLSHLQSLVEYDKNGKISGFIERNAKNPTQENINKRMFHTPEIRSLNNKKTRLQVEIGILRGDYHY